MGGLNSELIQCFMFRKRFSGMGRLLLILCLGILFSSCSRKHHSYARHYQFKDPMAVPDYNRLDYWAAHPWKKDLSDSVPKPLRSQQRDSLADVFFIHPTTYTGIKNGWNADINNTMLNAETDYSTILYQSSVFNQHCRGFAPRYRQAHISAFFTNAKEASDAFDTAYSDLKRAFEFYLQHYNHDRPIIIAGHSQGGKMALRLLQDFFDGKPLQKKLVAAYIVGWPIPQNSFEFIPVCKDSVQTNCFCGWRTFQEGYTPVYVQTETSTSFVTNRFHGQQPMNMSAQTKTREVY